MSDNADGAPSDKRNNRTVPALPMASDNGGALEPLTALDPELRDDFRGAYALNTVRTYRAAWRGGKGSYRMDYTKLFPDEDAEGVRDLAYASKFV